MVEGELVVIEAEQMRQRGVQIAHVMSLLDGFRASLVGGADAVAGFAAAADHSEMPYFAPMQ